MVNALFQGTNPKASRRALHDAFELAPCPRWYDVWNGEGKGPREEKERRERRGEEFGDLMVGGEGEFGRPLGYIFDGIDARVL